MCSVTGSSAASSTASGPSTSTSASSSTQSTSEKAVRDADRPTSWTGGGADAVKEAGDSVSESIRAAASSLGAVAPQADSAGHVSGNADSFASAGRPVGFHTHVTSTIPRPFPPVPPLLHTHLTPHSHLHKQPRRQGLAPQGGRPSCQPDGWMG